MLEQHFLSTGAPPATHPDVFGPLQGAERALWQGRCAVAEYSFDQAASLPRWALPESTEVLITDQRVLYAYTRTESPDDIEVTSGELRWLWPHHLRVQPGARTTGRAAAAAQIQLVCAASDGSFPALVFAGGDLATVKDADQLANLIRHAIARFRVDNADKLGLSVPQERMLSRMLIGPEFSNFQGGEGQTVTLLGALSVHRPAQDAPLPIEPARASAPVVTEPPAAVPVRIPSQRVPGHRPGLAADEARALQAAAAEQATHRTQPDLASRAASIAARVANLVATTDDRTDQWSETSPWAVPQPSVPEQPAAAQRSAAWSAPAGHQDAGWAAPDRDADPAPDQDARWSTSDRDAGWAPDRDAGWATTSGQDADWAAAEQAAAAERSAAEWAAAQAEARQAAADRAAAAERIAAQRSAAAEQAAIERAAAEEEAIAEQIALERAAAERAATEWAAAQAAARRAAAEAARQAAAAQASEQLVDFSDSPTTDLSARAENVRRASARFAGNSGRAKAGTRRAEPEIGSTTRGNRNR